MHATRSPFRRILLATLLLAGAPATVTAESGDDAWTDPASGIRFVRMPAGCFEMGEHAAGPAPPFAFPIPMPDELPRHRVCVREFWIGRTEVTRGQWRRVMAPDDAVPSRPEQAMTDVSWHDAKRFAAVLSASKRGEQAGRNFRLPTEAEWEYACHAGERRTAVTVEGEDSGAFQRWAVERAWYEYPFIRDRWAHDVGQKRPNAWGLHDMLGNVMEWTEDAYLADGYRRHASSDPRVAEAGAPKVVRGGSFRSPLERIRCGARFSAPEQDFTPVIGIRMVMTKEVVQ